MDADIARERAAARDADIGMLTVNDVISDFVKSSAFVGKPALDAFNECCRSTKQMIKFEVFKRKHDEYSAGYRINAFILYSALAKKPINDSYRLLCELESSENINYPDFDWKYYQYLNGSREMRLVRSPEDSRKTLFDMPLAILEKFYEVCDPDSSASVKYAIATTENHMEKLAFHLEEAKMSLVLLGWNITFERSANGSQMYIRNLKTKTVRHDLGTSFEKSFVDEAISILKNRRLRVGQLVFYLNRQTPWSNLFENSLNALDFQLDVQSFEITSAPVVNIINNIKPQKLREIKIAVKLSLQELHTMSQTDQWKGAQSLKLLQLEGFGLSGLLHFKEVRIETFTGDECGLIRELLDHSTHLSFAEFCFPWTKQKEIGSYLDNVFDVTLLHDSGVLRYSIQDSEDHFLLNISGYKLTVKRVEVAPLEAQLA